MKAHIQVDDFTGKYLPPHVEIASGEHPIYGPFRILESVADGAIIVECRGERKAITLWAIMDGLFEAMQREGESAV